MIKNTGRIILSLIILALGIAAGIYVEHNLDFLQIEPPKSETEKVWPADFELVEIQSPIDHQKQKAYFRAAPDDQARPLIVSLHSWSIGYQQHDTLAALSKINNIHYIHPDFRGVNKTPEACCSEKALADVDAAIDYALLHAKVDTSRIYVTGTSGGGYATLAMFMRSRHRIRKFVAWVPLANLVSWYTETSTRKLKYAPEILGCTDSKDGKLNEEVARQRSPAYWKTPLEKLSYSSLSIYAGVYDGLEGNGPIPITQSINFYNKILREAGVEDSSKYISEKEKLKLLELRRPLSDFGMIGDREICLQKKWGKVSLVIFRGGHEMLPGFAFTNLVDDTR